MLRSLSETNVLKHVYIPRRSIAHFSISIKEKLVLVPLTSLPKFPVIFYLVVQ